MVARHSPVTRAMGLVAAFTVAGFATTRAASAQQPSDGIAPADARQSISVAGDMELSRLVELTSATLGASVEYQPAELSKRVTLHLREAMTPTELWDAMAATLEVNGVVLIDTGKPGLFKALPIAHSPQAARVLLPDEAKAQLFGERSPPDHAVHSVGAPLPSLFY